MYLLLLLLALFLFPIAVYCSVLGLINRRTQPLMVSGAWDFVGVLLATSGFLLFVGPALLSGAFRQSLRDLPYSRESTNIGAAVSEIWAAWWLVWLLYYLLVVGGAAFLVWTRQATTVIYNVDLPTLEAVLAQTARRLGLEANRLGDRIFLGVSGKPTPLTPASETPTEVMARPVLPAPEGGRADMISEQVVLDVEVFSLLHNISLHWRSASPAARADLERELNRGLNEAMAPDNAAGGWLLGIAAFLFLAIMMLTAVFIMGAVLTRR